MEFKFESGLWEWHGPAAWSFISLPSEYYAEIRKVANFPKVRGFGSLKVEATIGKSTWKTSIFPDAKSKTYLLPVKKQIRNKESIKLGMRVAVKIRIIDI